MKLKELLENIDIISTNADPKLEISGISYDSRKTQKGDMFVAIKGFEADGHRFIPKAKEKGAAAVLCQDIPETDIPYIQVADCRRALAMASCAFYDYPARRMCIVGFTGTSGKTSSSYLMKHLLEEKLGAKVGLVGTNGNMIGEELIHTEHTTPESLELQGLFRRMADEGCTHVVMEVSSHSLCLERVAGIQFNAGIYTNLSQDHLDFHGTMEEYARAKSLLFEVSDKGAFNLDDEWAQSVCRNARCDMLSYSAGKNEAALYAEDIEYSAEGVRFTAVYGGERHPVSLGIPGVFSVYNALSVIAAGLQLGISLTDCAEAMSTAHGVKGRMEIVPTDGDYSIIIDYSHKPDALEKALKTLRPVTRGRLIVLFGCGGDRDKLKRPIMGAIAAENADLVVVTSDNPRTEKPEDIIEEILVGLKDKSTPYVSICDRVEAIQRTIDNVGAGDVILLAGKGHEDYQVVGHEKRHMDEREIVADHLKTRRLCAQ